MPLADPEHQFAVGTHRAEPDLLPYFGGLA
jgi:hypothetical protein